MLLLDWYQQWLEIRAEFRLKATEVHHEETICQSCETLKQQLDIANYEKQELLKKLLKEPEPIKETEAPQVTRPRAVPWNVRRQMLEREDKEKAKLLKNAPKPDSSFRSDEDVKSTEELEKELDIAAETRDRESAGKE